ncbi:MAG: DUF3169 family protein [Anaerococcus sp.]|nr:DUF3169 family protein [Anaerococcus sp.]
MLKTKGSKMNSKVKFFLKILGISILGLMVGMVFVNPSLRYINKFLEVAEDFLSRNIFPIFILVSIGLGLMAYISYRIGKKKVLESLSNDDGIRGDFNLKLSLALSDITIVLSFLLTFSFIKSRLENAYNLTTAIIQLIILVSLVFFLSYLNKFNVDLLKKIDPNLYDKTLNLRFYSKFIESMDEREKYDSYRAGYKAYKNMVLACFIAILPLGFILITIGESLLPIYILGGVLITGYTSYIKNIDNK